MPLINHIAYIAFIAPMINVFKSIAISQIVFKRVELAKYQYVHKTTMRVVVSKTKTTINAYTHAVL
jgi:hypothetical protein